MNEPSYLTLPNGERLAYHRSAGKGTGVMFLGGFRSDMEGTKAVALEGWCREWEVPFLRFDYSGHGRSDGAFIDGTIGRWKDDALAAFDQLTQGPQILIGSSMGGWIMLLLALARPERLQALIGIASAPDFTEDLMWKAWQPAMQTALKEEKILYLPSEYGEPQPITWKLIEEGRHHLLMQGNTLAITCPVCLLHGMQDKDVPWQLSTQIAEKLAGQDVQAILLPHADHRLSDEGSLERLKIELGLLLGR